MSLAQIIYQSRVRHSGGEGHQQLILREILVTSQLNNARDGLSGFLLFDRTLFFQVLEGERAPLMRTYDRILHDPRHTDIALLALRDISARSFPQCPMSGVTRTPAHSNVYVRHGFPGTIDPARITAPSFLALAMDLQDQQTAPYAPAAADAAA